MEIVIKYDPDETQDWYVEEIRKSVERWLYLQDYENIIVVVKREFYLDDHD